MKSVICKARLTLLMISPSRSFGFTWVVPRRVSSSCRISGSIDNRCTNCRTGSERFEDRPLPRSPFWLARKDIRTIRTAVRVLPSWRRSSTNPDQMKKALDVVSTVLMALAAAFVLWTQVESRWFKPAPPAAVRPLTNVAIDSTKIRHVKGDADVALVEFTDYECPFCGRHARETDPDIEPKLVASDVVRHVVFSFPLPIHRHARKAGEAAECAARQRHYWEMHQRLFQHQDALDEADLLKAADDLGLDHAAFARCLAGEAADQVTADVSEGRRLGVNSTPTFFIGKVQPDGSIQLTTQLRGALPYQQFQNAVEAAAPRKRAQR